MGKGRSRVVAAFGWGHSNTVITERSHGEKMGQSLGGSCVGFVIVFASIITLSWNEYYTVQSMKLIEEGEDSVKDADCNAFDPSLNSQLVFLSCDLTGLGSLSVAAPFAPPPPPPPILPPPPPPGVPPPPPYIAPDPYSWASAPNGLRVDTKIEYYAWVEHKRCMTVDCSGPGVPSTFRDGTPSGCRAAGTSMEKCDYTMSAEWTESIQTSFQNPAKTGQQYYDALQNRYMASHICSGVDRRSSSWGSSRSGTWGCSLSVPTVYASSASVGTAYPLDRAAIDEIAKTAHTGRITPSCGTWNWQATRDGSYCCIDSATCSMYSYSWSWDSSRWGSVIGDRRVSFTATTSSGKASVLALQTGSAESAFRKWRADGHRAGPAIYRVVDGVQTKEQMFELLRDEESSRKWVCRFGGWLFMWLGLQLVTGPLTVAPQAIPWIGKMIGSLVAEALCVFNCAIATSWSLTLIAICWVSVRPEVGVPVLLVGCGFMGGAAFVRSRQGKRSNATGGFHALAANV